MNGILAIYDSDIDYAHNLSEYFRSRDDFSYDIVVFTDFHSLKSYNISHIDILLTSVLVEQDSSIGDIFLLCEEEPPDCPYKIIIKYQSAENILRTIMEFSSMNYIPLRRTCTEIIGVSSPLGRCGKTSLSISLGLHLSQTASTLLISFDTFSFLQKFSNAENNRDISDLLFYFQHDKENFSNRLLSLSYNINNLKFITPTITPNRVKSPGNSCWLQLINAIADTGIYDYIILDISNSFSDCEEFFDICSKVFMPALDDMISQNKLEIYADYLKHLFTNFPKHIESVTLPAIRHCETLDEYLHELKYGSFGTDSLKLLNDVKEE